MTCVFHFIPQTNGADEDPVRRGYERERKGKKLAKERHHGSFSPKTLIVLRECP